MDLVSIRRKYRNIRNIIAVIFGLIIFIILIIIAKELYLSLKQEDVYKSYLYLIQQAQITEQKNAEQKEAERLAKLPKLTSEGKNNISNIYNSETKRVFLTFDDGPSKTVTPEILDILNRENIKATFFLLGSRVDLYPDIVKREYDEGHYLASHGYSHIYSQLYSSPQNTLDEYNKCIESIRNAIGEKDYNPHLFRFPGGYKGGKYAEVKEQAAQLLEQNEIMHVDWNALTADSAGAKTTEEFISELEKTVPKHNSIVVLMHDAGNKKATAEALPTIIQYFRERGFEFDNFYNVIK